MCKNLLADMSYRTIRSMSNIGYARVSTQEQILDLQTRALEEAGCVRVFQETVSSRKADRKELARALDFCREGDVLVVWKLDRLGRSIKELIEIVTGLADRGIGFMSLTESLDTTSPSGRLVFHVFASMAEFERDVIRERSLAGLAAARARGRLGGRRPVLSTKQMKIASRMLADRETPVGDVAVTLGVSRSTLYRLFEPNGTLRPAAEALMGSENR